jgi:hypothetical protein
LAAGLLFVDLEEASCAKDRYCNTETVTTTEYPRSTTTGLPDLANNRASYAYSKESRKRTKSRYAYSAPQTRRNGSISVKPTDVSGSFLKRGEQKGPTGTMRWD